MDKFAIFLLAVCFYGVHAQGEGDIRLAEGNEFRKGRVEIYENGAWGTVCDNSWDINDANVVCEQIGFPGASEAKGNAYFGQGCGDILLNNVRCDGTEDLLDHCPSDSEGLEECQHSDDAGVICNHAIRLVDQDGNTDTHQGRVELYYEGGWGTICDTKWDIKDANVVCKLLGYTGASDFTTGASFGEGTGLILLDEVQCAGVEEDIATCPRGPFGQNSCTHAQDAGVVCKLPVDGDIRLPGGNGPDEGRVEIYKQGAWGTVCDTAWDINDANVVCKQLGYPSASEATTGASFGEGSGYIWLNDVQCTGTETKLSECTNDRLHGCTHARDAGVVCNPDIRLVDRDGDTDTHQGRVELFYRGEWGTIRDDDWSIEDGDVVCRSLGFPGAQSIKTRSFFGPGSGPIWMDEVRCYGNEKHVRACPSNEFPVSDCDDNDNCEHSRDAGVVCTPRPAKCEESQDEKEEEEKQQEENEETRRTLDLLRNLLREAKTKRGY